MSKMWTLQKFSKICSVILTKVPGTSRSKEDKETKTKSAYLLPYAMAISVSLARKP